MFIQVSSVTVSCDSLRRKAQTTVRFDSQNIEAGLTKALATGVYPQHPLEMDIPAMAPVIDSNAESLTASTNALLLLLASFPAPMTSINTGV
jgi:hypothetical protein